VSILLLEAWAQCAGCGRRVNLVAVSNVTSCDECGAKTDLADDWQGLGTPVEAKNQTEGALHVQTERATKFVPCPMCEHKHPKADVLATTDATPIVCACGETLRCRAAERGLSWPRGTRFFGEGEEPSHEGREAVVVACASCGANLDVDGTSRSVACKYCGAANVLDEAVWRRLHPIRRIRRFAVLIDDAAAKAEAAENARAIEARRETRRLAHQENVDHRVANLNALPRPRALPSWQGDARPSGVAFAIILLVVGVVTAVALFPNGLFITLLCTLASSAIVLTAANARRTAWALRHGDIVAGKVKKADRVVPSSKSDKPKVKLTITYKVKGRDRTLLAEFPGENGQPARTIKEGMLVFVAVDGNDGSRAVVYALA
jgi:DNA-directed RNA polymerase subunit RPC12/RpoP